MASNSNVKDLDEKYAERMAKIAECDDYEHAHGQADDLLREILSELGFCKTVEQFDEVGKWYA